MSDRSRASSETFASSIARQCAQLWPTLLCAFGFVVLVAIGVFAVSVATDVRISRLTRDPVAFLRGGESFHGLLSHLGVMFWAGTVAICFFGAAAARHATRADARMLVGFGLLSLLLGLDDALLFHEEMLPDLLGTSEEMVLAAYGVLAASLLGVFLRRILRSDFVLLGLSLAFFATSVGMDVFLDFSNFETYFEDCAKFAGLVFWFAYFFRCALRAVRATETAERTKVAHQVEVSNDAAQLVP